MLHSYEYVNEKLREFELEALARMTAIDSPRRRKRPVVGPLVLAAGRTIKRFGERMEGWAAAEPAPVRNDGGA